MTAIENQQIKGMTIGTFKSVLVSTVVICSTIIGIYYSLVAKIDKIAQSTESNNKLTELRLSYLEQKINALEIQINQIKSK
jgi:cell division protein FtsX